MVKYLLRSLFSAAAVAKRHASNFEQSFSVDGRKAKKKRAILNIWRTVSLSGQKEHFSTRDT